MGEAWLEWMPVLSLLFEVGAAVLALNLIRVTGWRFAWLAVAAAAVLLAVRTVAALRGPVLDLSAERLELAVAVALLAGVSAVAPRFRSVRRADAALRESEERYRRMVDEAREGVWLLDEHARTIYVNPCMAEMLGCPVEAVLGRPLFQFLDPIARGEAERSFKRHRLGAEEQYDLRFRRSDGSDLWTIFSANQLVDGEGRLIGTMGVVTDITGRKGEERRIIRLAQYDLLTGLPNRGLLGDRLRQALAHARRHRKRAALLFVDLDHFKPINDRHGHAVGDGVLRAVAARLLSRVRQVDTVARYGGDEFVVVLQDLASAEEAALLAASFVEMMAEPCTVDGIGCQVGASIGVSVYPDDADGEEALLRCADEAMYRAKEAGGGCYRFCAVDKRGRIG